MTSWDNEMSLHRDAFLLLDQAGEVVDRFLEFGQQRRQEARGHGRGDFAEIPDHSIAAAAEPRPDRGSRAAVILQHSPGVVQFVGADDEQGLVRGVLEMVDVGDFASLPRRFGRFVGVGASEHQFGNLIAVALANQASHGFATLVFDGVMQHGGNGLGFRTAIFEDETRDGQQMRDVRNLRPFAILVRVEIGGKVEGFGELRREGHRVRQAGLQEGRNG